MIGRKRKLIAYFISVGIVLGVSFIVGRLILQLSLGYVFLSALLSVAAVTIGILIGVRYGERISKG